MLNGHPQTATEDPARELGPWMASWKVDLGKGTLVRSRTRTTDSHRSQVTLLQH